LVINAVAGFEVAGLGVFARVTVMTTVMTHRNDTCHRNDNCNW
jgi:hypothetical protein